MLCEAASELGIETAVLANRADESAAGIAGEVVLGAPTDHAVLAAFASACDVVTFDHELVDLQALDALAAAGHVVRPSPDALEAAVDKAAQRRRFADAGLPVPEFRVLAGRPDDDAAELVSFASSLGAPPVLKAARGGYDGRGVVMPATMAEATEALARWRAAGVVVVAERPVPFRAELAALVARRPGGEVASWPAVRTTQLDGVCREVRVPGGVAAQTASAARALAERIAALLGAVGVLAVELFELAPGELVVNEVALRPHNSGHWTIEGATTSQFENHLRAVCDLPLGATTLTAAATATVNVFGGERTPGDDALARALADPAVKVHLYGKEHRAGRKLGHVTVTGADEDDAAARAWRAAAELGTPVPAEVAR